MTNYNEPNNAIKKFTDKPEVKAVLSDAKSLSENASNLVASAKEDGVAFVKESKKYVKDTAEKDFEVVKAYVKEHPTKSIAFAVLGGLVLSHLLGRK